MQDRKVNLIVDKRCNMHCEYCEHGNTQYKDRSDEEIYRDFDYCISHIESQYGTSWIPQLQGGELTLFNKHLTFDICQRLDKYHPVIFSNGTNKDSPFYSNQFRVVTHIIDWIGFDISSYQRKENETLAFVIRRCDLIDFRVQRLLRTGNPDIPIILMPCWSSNPDWNCGYQDKSIIHQLENRYYHKEDPDEELSPDKLCNSMRIPMVDCTERSFTYCGFIGDYKPITDFQNKNLYSYSCKDITENEFCGPGVPSYRHMHKRKLDLPLWSDIMLQER